MSDDFLSTEGPSTGLAFATVLAQYSESCLLPKPEKVVDEETPNIFSEEKEEWVRANVLRWSGSSVNQMLKERCKEDGVEMKADELKQVETCRPLNDQ